ncbi:MAG: hypothetical protein KGR23_10305 [Betaproteobacteria bacterium]|nr:hypothetical protein [Betaproteobacteria bacterium]
MSAASQTDSARVATSPPTGGVLGELSNVLTCARETVSAYLDLVTLEARQAGVALVRMMVGGLVAAICMVTAWMGLMGALVMYVVSLGLLPIAAVILVAAINLVAGGGLLYWCIGVSRDLLFTATRRQLAGPSMAKPSAP